MHTESDRQGHGPEERTALERFEHIETPLEEMKEEVLEILEIEAHAATGKRKPKARVYAFRVGKTRIEVLEPVLTGRRILELAGKVPPENYTLRQVEHGGVLKPIELDDEVDLRAPGIERFRAMPRTASDG
jgi:Multiubiquitin